MKLDSDWIQTIFYSHVMHRSTPSVQFAFRCLLVSEGAIICRGGSQGAIYHAQSVGRKQNCVTTKVYNYLSQSWTPTGFIHELDWIGLGQKIVIYFNLVFRWRPKVGLVKKSVTQFRL